MESDAHVVVDSPQIAGIRIANNALTTRQVEDVDLTRDDEHLTVVGKGSKRRTILLDDPRLVAQLRAYVKRTGYQSGYLFRAYKHGDGRALRYQTIHERWQRYCQQVGVHCTLHQLRHLHATELVIRKKKRDRHTSITLKLWLHLGYIPTSEPKVQKRFLSF